MIRNFKLSDSVTLSLTDTSFDLHNFFDLQSLSYDYQHRTLTLVFIGIDRLLGYPAKASLEFRGIQKLSSSCGIMNLKEQTLDEMGFKNPDDNDLDWLIEEQMASVADDFVMRFIHDEYLRIHCNQIIATLQR